MPVTKTCPGAGFTTVPVDVVVVVDVVVDPPGPMMAQVQGLRYSSAAAKRAVTCGVNARTMRKMPKK